MYTWLMDRKFHKLHAKGEARTALAHRMPYKATYYPNVLGEGDVPFKSSERCVCHLMKLYAGEEVTAWPYRALWGNVGISWYHEGAGA